MKTACIISDTHGLHNKIQSSSLKEADIIIHAGDISNIGTVQGVNEFLAWFASLDQYKYKLFIAGNHDWLFERNPGIAKSMIPDNIIYLQDSAVEIENFKFYGSPQTIEFCNWAFNVKKENLKKYWDVIPTDTDILITHGNPYDILDKTVTGYKTGCKFLADKINEIKPKLYIGGHIHEARGHFQSLDTLYINASVLDEDYRMVNEPYLINLETMEIISS